MSAMKCLIGGCVLVCSLLTTTAIAQGVRAPIGTEREPVAAVAPLVTATATATRVRFVAPGTVVQLRLEVFNETGQKVFDTELRGGNVLDWHLQDGAGDRLPPGAYASVLTIKSLSGRLSQRLGLVKVNEEKVSIVAEGGAQLSTAQQQTIGPLEGNAAFTILQNSEAQAITTVTHDGTEGQVARTRGALSFRVGDFFSGNDSEQMRLTEAGNLGIGTDKPQAKLDVAGTIRTSEGIEFANADGTKVTRLTTTATGGLQQTLADGTVVPSATGTGTQNNLAKWTDNAGTLGDSSIFENASRNVGIGTTSPGAKLHAVGTQGSVGAGSFQLDTSTLFSNWTGAYPALEMVNTNLTNNNISLFQFADAPTGAAHAGIGAVNTSHTNKYGDLFFFTKQSDGYQMRMGIYGRNVGIGTTAPTATLDVAGNINTSTQYNIGGVQLVRADANNNVFVGLNSGNSNNTVGNSFFGTPTGKGNNGDFNSFFGQFAGISNTTGSENTMIGRGANVGSNNLTNATAIGANSKVDQSNSLVLGDTSVNVGIGTTTPAQRLHVNGDILMTTAPGNAIQFGTPNAETGMSIIKTNTGRADLRFDGSTLKLVTGPPNSGPPAATNGIVIDTAGRVGIGTTTPPARLTVKGPGTIDILRVEDASGLSGLIVRDDRIVAIGQLSSLEAASTHVCVDSFIRLSFCSSSLRYKQQVAPYLGGLDLIRRLRPISFTWKGNGTRDLGLGAEDVAKVEPLLVTHNNEGEIQGVKYDQLNVVLLNGIKQQQGQIEWQQVETKRQQDQIETLRTANVALNARLRLIERTLRNKHGSTRQRR